MRIVFLITVGAFLMTISIAESDVPIGTPQYLQRQPRPVVLEPVVRYRTKNEGNPFNRFLKMVSRVLEPSKRTSTAMIGPISIPGMGSHVYIKQVESSGLPWESNHIVIRMKTHNPPTGVMTPDESGLPHYRIEDSSRKIVKPYGYQTTNNQIMRPNSMTQQGFQPLSMSMQYNSASINTDHPPTQQYSYSHFKPMHGSLSNDFQYDNYGKGDQSFSTIHANNDYGPRLPFHNNYPGFQQSFSPANQAPITSIPPVSKYRSNDHESPTDSSYSSNYQFNLQFKDSALDSMKHETNFNPKDTRKPDRVLPTQVPYPVYPPLREDESRSAAPLKAGIESQRIDDNYAESSLQSPERYGQMVRANGMVSVPGNHRNQFASSTSQGRMAFMHNSQHPNESRGFGQASASKFDDDNLGGIQVINAPNLQVGWGSKPVVITDTNLQNSNSSMYSKDSDAGFNHDQDSIIMGDGRSLARGESAEHVEEDTDDQSILISRSGVKVPFTRIIDRSHRSQDSQKISSGSVASIENFEMKRIGNKKQHLPVASHNNTVNNQVPDDSRKNTKINNVTAEVVQKVVNLTASNNWRYKERRAPIIVKAIYRRKPVNIIKTSTESSEFVSLNSTRKDKISSESSTEN